MRIKFDPLIIFAFGLIAGVILSPLVRPLMASADYIQPVKVNTGTENLQTTQAYQYLGTGLQGTLQQAEWAADGNTTFIACLGIEEYNTYSDYLNNVNAISISPTGNRVVNNDLIRCDYNYSFNPNKHYVLLLSLSNVPGGYRAKGSYSGSGYQSPRGTQGSLGTAYFKLIGSDVEYNATLATPSFGLAKNTRFTDISVQNSTSTPENLDFDIEWFLDPNEVNRKVSSLNPATVKIQWSLRPTLDVTSRGFTIASTTGTSSDIFTILGSDFPDNGTVDIAVRFSNTGCDLGFSDCPFPDSYIYLALEMASGTISNVSDVENYNTVNVTPEQESCSITNVSACINNALVYLFVPSSNALNQFISLGDELDTVKPFGYFTRALDAIGGMGTSTPAYTMPDIPFQDTIFDPLKTGMSVMLWGIFAFVFYNKRLKNIDI